MKKRNVICFVIMLLFLVGCTTIKPTIIDQTGRQIPSPHYVLYSTKDKISSVFYYAMLAGKKDLDGTIQVNPAFLKMHNRYKFSSKVTTDVIIVIEISNPNEVEYHLWENSTRINKKGKKEFCSSLLAKSNRKYRQHNFKLPIDESLKEVHYGINLEDKDGHILIHFGNFHYEIK